MKTGGNFVKPDNKSLRSNDDEDAEPLTSRYNVAKDFAIESLALAPMYI
jgi:hypothetical protein